MKPIPEKLYETFTPSERIQLTLAALARSDDAEVTRLRSSCKYLTYRMRDTNYSFRMEGIASMTATFGEVCNHLCVYISLGESLVWSNVCSMRSFREGFNLGLELGGGEVPEPEKCNILCEKINSVLKEMKENKKFSQRQINILKSAYQAFSEICNEENLNLDDLLKWFQFDECAPALQDFLALEGIADESSLKTFKSVFKRLLANA